MPGQGSTLDEGSDSGSDDTARAIDTIVELAQGRTISVLTGAGVSTDSGIPDYRGEGAPVRSPMTFSEFLANENYRRRYWAGSHLGWKQFSAAAPNAGHRALAHLETAGIVNGVVTQNVDGLHVRGGSDRVVEIHGSMARVKCLSCDQFFARAAIAELISSTNPWVDEADAAELGPDGDVTPEHIAEFEIPACSVCGGILKPDVVFFGEFVPVERFAEARTLVQSSELLIIAGSSLAVNSGIRLLEVAARRRSPIVIINRGTTKGDAKATLKVEAGTTEVLTALAERLGR